MRLHDCDQNYRDDPAFRRLVDLLVGSIANLDYSPSEIREAAMYATYRVESMRPHPVLVSREEFERLGGVE